MAVDYNAICRHKHSALVDYIAEHGTSQGFAYAYEDVLRKLKSKEFIKVCRKVDRNLKGGISTKIMSSYRAEQDGRLLYTVGGPSRVRESFIYNKDTRVSQWQAPVSQYEQILRRINAKQCA
jgi:hypothetical protein